MPRDILSQETGNSAPAVKSKSTLNSWANKAVKKLKHAFDGSAVFTWLSTYPQFSGGDDNGIFKTVWRKAAKLFGIIRRFITKFIEESQGLEAIKSMMRVFLEADLPSWGICFIVSGLVTSLGKMVVNGGYSAVIKTDLNGVLFGAVLFVIGMFLVASRESVGRTIFTGPILRWLFIKVLCIDEYTFASCEPQRQYSAFAVLGLLIGACNIYFPYWMPLVVFAAILSAAILFCQPEVGVLAIVAALPFINTSMIILLSSVTVLAFLIKVVRGKRVVKIGLIDAVIAFFTLALIIFGFVLSNNPSASFKVVLLYLLFILVYLSTANAMSTMRWVDNLGGILIFDGTVVALIAILQYVSGFPINSDWVDLNFFSGISTRVVSTFDNPNVLAEYLILIIPIALAYAVIGKRKQRILATLALLILTASLALTYSRGAWIGIIIAAVLFALIYNTKLLKAVPFIAAIIPLAAAFMPASLVERFASIGNVADGSTAYRLNIWRGTLSMLKDNWFTGVGMGEQAFTGTYQMYAIENTVSAPHAHSIYLQVLSSLGILGLIAFIALIITVIRLCLDGFFTMQKNRAGVVMLGYGAGIFAFIIHGITENVWYNNRIVLLFWLIIGITVARSRTYNSEWNDAERGE